MAFQFPEDKQDFKAPNGITYTYNDGTWMVKTFGSKVPDPLTYTIQTDKVLRSGEAAIELLDSEGYFSNVKFEADGLIAVGSNPASIVISSEQIEEKYDEGLSEHDERLDVHSSQINLLETQIQLLAQAQVVGHWNYVRNISGGSIRPPAAKTFYATHKDGAENVVLNWADARLLMISKTDLNDVTYTFTNFEEGDKVEILAVDGSSACYGTVTNQPQAEAYGNLIIAVERSSGGPRDDKEFIISVYRPGAVSGDVDLDILDGRYLIKAGDTMEGALSVNYPSVDDHAANKKYVDDAVGLNTAALDKYLPIAGGTMNGTLTIDKPRTDSNTNCFTIKGRIMDSGSLTEGILLKSYKRQNSASTADYIAYYGQGGGANEVLNRTTAQGEFLRLSGGTLTGTLTGMLVKSVRETGYAFEVKPGNTGDATAFIHTNGDIKAKKLKVESDLASGADRPFEIKGRLSDGTTVSKDFFYMYANSDGTASAMNYDGKISSEKNIVNKGFVDNKVPGRFTFESGALYYNT